MNCALQTTTGSVYLYVTIYIMSVPNLELITVYAHSINIYIPSLLLSSRRRLALLKTKARVYVCIGKAYTYQPLFIIYHPEAVAFTCLYQSRYNPWYTASRQFTNLQHLLTNAYKAHPTEISTYAIPPCCSRRCIYIVAEFTMVKARMDCTYRLQFL